MFFLIFDEVIVYLTNNKYHTFLNIALFYLFIVLCRFDYYSAM